MRSLRKYLDESYTKLFQMNQIHQPVIKQGKNIDNPATPAARVDEPSTYEKQNNAQHLIITCIRKISLKNKRNIRKNKVVIKIREIDY
jgi:hypothetical protein